MLASWFFVFGSLVSWCLVSWFLGVGFLVYLFLGSWILASWLLGFLDLGFLVSKILGVLVSWPLSFKQSFNVLERCWYHITKLSFQLLIDIDLISKISKICLGKGRHHFSVPVFSTMSDRFEIQNFEICKTCFVKLIWGFDHFRKVFL